MKMIKSDTINKCKKITIYTMIGNVFISVLFLLTGILGKSIASISEGIDSLTDVVGSLLLLLGFKVSARKPDSLHPQGHQRFEYIIGLLLSELILFAAFSLGKEAVDLLLHPAVSPASFLMIIACIAGIIGKLIIYFFIYYQNRTLHSASLDTYAQNALADLKGILFIVIAAIVQRFTTFPVDAVAGLIIALFIFLDGLKSFMHNVSLLIGENEGCFHFN